MQIARRGILVALLTSAPLAATSLQQISRPGAFTVEQVLGFPSPENLVASPVGSTIAWTFNERGVRNVYVADGPAFEPRRLTPYREDDGQELTQLSFTRDGATLVYVRGGDHGSNRQAEAPPNPAGNPVQPKIQIWSVPVAGGAPRLVGDGDEPAAAPDSARVAFVRNKQIWAAPIDGSKPAQQLFYARGTSESPAWSPDGRTLAFVSSRNDHSFIGLFTEGEPVRFVAPSTFRDSMPAWSTDGHSIAFLRQPGAGGIPRAPLARLETPPWSIQVANVRDTDLALVTAVTSGHSPVDPILRNPGGIGLQWAAGNALVFLSYRDGFPHLYAIQHPGRADKSGQPTLLTPGPFMVEQVALTPDGRFAVYNANTGGDAGDIDRRHLYKVAVNGSAPAPLTTGLGVEWNPVVTADGQTVAFLGSDAQRPRGLDLHIVGQHLLDQHGRRTGAIGRSGRNPHRSFGAGEPQVARCRERPRRLHAAIHLIGAQALRGAVHAHRHLAGGLARELFQLAARHRRDSRGTADPQILSRVLGDELDFVAGQAVASGELRELPVCQQEQPRALGADPKSAARVLVERPDFLAAQAVEKRVADELAAAVAA